jgi:hypothetical protein
MSASGTASQTWPADIIHVNEDGWVLVNRGLRHGVPIGLRLLVVGQSIRDLRDLVADGQAAESDEAAAPAALRIRRTYELLEVVYVEGACAVAIAARTPAGRRPQFYRGPEGELLVWVPLPPDFTYPKPGVEDEPHSDDEATDETDDMETADETQDGERAAALDTPPERADQEDERWEEALPLNGVSVGDRVVPAVPASPATQQSAPSVGDGSGAGSPGSPAVPFEQGRSYDWIKPE